MVKLMRVIAIGLLAAADAWVTYPSGRTSETPVVEVDVPSPFGFARALA